MKAWCRMGDKSLVIPYSSGFFFWHWSNGNHVVVCCKFIGLALPHLYTCHSLANIIGLINPYTTVYFFSNIISFSNATSYKCNISVWNWPNTMDVMWALCKLMAWARYQSLAQSKLRLCSANHRPGYWSDLPWDWPSTAWAYSEQETENGAWYFSTNAAVVIGLSTHPCIFSCWMVHNENCLYLGLLLSTYIF